MPQTALLGEFTDVPASPAGEQEPADGSAVLTFEMQSQKQPKWCWAAVTSSVCAYYAQDGAASPSQCQIATQFLGMECCATPWPDGSDQAFTLEVPLQVLGHLPAPTVVGSVDMSTIIGEIKGRRPVCCHIDWGDDQGHFVVIVGYDQLHNDVIARDPAGTIANGIHPFNGAKTFPGGTWTETYLTG
jgi:Papain-like cysteine protease AvrRpt2